MDYQKMWSELNEKLLIQWEKLVDTGDKFDGFTEAMDIVREIERSAQEKEWT